MEQAWGKFEKKGQIAGIIPFFLHLKDDIDNNRTLFTVLKDNLKAREEANRLAELHERKMPRKNLFTKGQKTGKDSKPDERKLK